MTVDNWTERTWWFVTAENTIKLLYNKPLAKIRMSSKGDVITEGNSTLYFYTIKTGQQLSTKKFLFGVEFPNVTQNTIDIVFPHTVTLEENETIGFNINSQKAGSGPAANNLCYGGPFGMGSYREDSAVVNFVSEDNPECGVVLFFAIE